MGAPSEGARQKTPGAMLPRNEPPMMRPSRATTRLAPSHFHQTIRAFRLMLAPAEAPSHAMEEQPRGHSARVLAHSRQRRLERDLAQRVRVRARSSRQYSQRFSPTPPAAPFLHSP